MFLNHGKRNQVKRKTFIILQQIQLPKIGYACFGYATIKTELLVQLNGYAAALPLKHQSHRIYMAGGQAGKQR
jgi:hypothetical protein